MRQLLALIVALVFCFFSSWLYKMNNPESRPDAYQEGVRQSAGSWYSQATLNDKEENWTLDKTIPANYIPVLGMEEVYMVVDNNGKILKYRKRTKQIDGTWKWEDYNPDIPIGYEPVPGLENVYKVTQEDGTVKYYKYIRNDDDTYAFVEVDKHGNELNKNRDASTVDGLHVHIKGNLYERLNEHGVVIGYDKRVANADGTFSWLDAEMPEASDDSKLQQLQSEWALNQGGSGSSDLQVPQLEDPSIDIPSMSQPSINVTDQGSGIDQATLDKFAQILKDALANANLNGGQTATPQTDYSIFGGMDAGDPATPEAPVVINNPDGTHTEEITTKETKNIDGNTITYETYVKNTYDADGNLIKTQTDGPYEVDATTQAPKEETPQTGDRSQKKATLKEEVYRVVSGYQYDTDKAEKVYVYLNAQRAQNGLSSVPVSESLTRLAMLRAADMANYDTSNAKLPTYGSLGTMMAEYNVASYVPGENMWKTVERSADDIHSRMQALDSSRKTRMDGSISGYGCAICVKNGNMYFCEIVN